MESLIEVRSSSIHCTGVFASQFIPKEKKIIEYVGEKITKKEAETRAINPKTESKGKVYLFELNKRYDIDGDVPYNLAKYINHSCSPNCEVVIENNHIWVIALREIKSGEEVTFNYGYEFDEDFKQHPCYCNNSNCKGYILAEKHWNKIHSTT